MNKHLQFQTPTSHIQLRYSQLISATILSALGTPWHEDSISKYLNLVHHIFTLRALGKPFAQTPGFVKFKTNILACSRASLSHKPHIFLIVKFRPIVSAFSYSLLQQNLSPGMLLGNPSHEYQALVKFKPIVFACSWSSLPYTHISFSSSITNQSPLHFLWHRFPMNHVSLLQQNF